MRRFLSIIIMAMLWLPLYAQAPATTSAVQSVSMVKTDWLSPFSKVEVNGPLRISFKRVNTAEEMKICYDTKGNLTSKFKADVDANGVLRITERFDPQRTTVTEVTLYYTSLDAVEISQARAEFEDTIDTRIFDLRIAGGAVVSLGLDCLDVNLSCTGKSSVVLKGATRYMTMDVSSAKVDCWGMTSISTVVKASHNADVRVLATERLEASTATSAKLFYRGKPTIVRVHTQLFGGDIIALD